MTFKPGAMTDYELKAEIEHHRALMEGLSPQAPARVTLQRALDAFLNECEDRRQIRSARIPSADAPFPDDAS
jgi:hypothetical protein